MTESAASAGIAPGFDVRGEVRREGELVIGWCFSPDRPRDRLRVGLYLDDVLAGSTVAARYRGDLVRDGVCDGYHGFSLPLPRHTTSAALIELRELQTGHAFGRLLPAERSDVKAWATQITVLESHTVALNNTPPPGVAARLGAAFATLGAAIAPRVDQAAAHLACLRLPPIAAPRMSLVLCASWGMHDLVGDALPGLAPHLGRLHAELLICDDGRHAFSQAFAAIANCRHVRLDETTPTDLPSVALRAARSPLLVFLDPALIDPNSLVALPAILADSNRVLAGGAVGRVLANINVANGVAARPFLDGVLLAGSPASLSHHESPGETPRGIVYRLADRALLAQTAGAEVQLARPRAAPSILLGHETQAAERAFAKRWDQTRRGRLLRGTA